eukprot:757860-Hanusia_phi.AAC.1
MSLSSQRVNRNFERPSERASDQSTARLAGHSTCLLIPSISLHSPPPRPKCSRILAFTVHVPTGDPHYLIFVLVSRSMPHLLCFISYLKFFILSSLVLRPSAIAYPLPTIPSASRLKLHARPSPTFFFPTARGCTVSVVTFQ